MSCVQVAAQVLRFRMTSSFDPLDPHSLFLFYCVWHDKVQPEAGRRYCMSHGVVSKSSAPAPDDMKKLAFTTAALDGPDPFEQKTEIPVAVRQAVSWCAERTDSQIIREREVIIASIEQEGNALW